jgi:hypothetical protein
MWEGKEGTGILGRVSENAKDACGFVKGEEIFSFKQNMLCISRMMVPAK